MIHTLVQASTAGTDRPDTVAAARQRLLIIDDHRLFAELLTRSMVGEADLECVGAVHDARTALSMAQDLQPDVILMGAQLGDGDGVALTRQLTQQLPEVRVVVLTAFVDHLLLQRATEAGACALLAKDGKLESLLHVIRTAPRGGFVAQADLFDRSGRLTDVAAPSHLTLTDLHTTILKMLASGFDVQAIGRELDLTTQSCIAHIADVLAKMRVSTTLEAVVLAMNVGLLTWGPPR